MIASTGYTGGAWDTDPSGATITGNTTYTYTFTATPTCTVTFNANGHGTAPATQTVTSGGTASEPTAPTADGWTFGGWYQDATCSVAFDFATPITANTELYAKWTEVPATTYTVTFDTNGGSATTSQTVADGSKATKPADPTKADSTFDGWYQDATFTVAFDFDTAITADITLYAKWKTNSVTETVYYTVVSGANGNATQGTDYEIKVKRSADDDKTYSDYFTGVKIDDKELVNGTDYTAAAGSVIITIKGSTLQNLSVGGHTVTVVFKDGTAVTSINVKAASSGGSNAAVPSTGEAVAPALWVGSSCMVVAGMLFAVVLVQKKRKSAQR